MLRGGNFLEQTGYEIKSLRKIALYSPFGHFSRTTHFFEATIIGKSATLSKKDPRSPFFLLAALPKNLVPLYHDLIKDALDPNCPSKKTYAPLVLDTRLEICIQPLHICPLFVGQALLVADKQTSFQIAPVIRGSSQLSNRTLTDQFKF
jgi:hypothetical protein